MKKKKKKTIAVVHYSFNNETPLGNSNDDVVALFEFSGRFSKIDCDFVGGESCKDE